MTADRNVVAEDGYQERDDCAALRARIEALAGDLWRVGCNCGHTVESHTRDGCIAGLSLCPCPRNWPSIVSDRLRAALEATP